MNIFISHAHTERELAEAWRELPQAFFPGSKSSTPAKQTHRVELVLDGGATLFFSSCKTPIGSSSC